LGRAHGKKARAVGTELNAERQWRLDGRSNRLLEPLLGRDRTKCRKAMGPGGSVAGEPVNRWFGEPVNWWFGEPVKRRTGGKDRPKRREAIDTHWSTGPLATAPLATGFRD